MLFSVLAFSLPVFLIGYLLIWGFAIQLQWLPVQGYVPLPDGVGAVARAPRAAVRQPGAGLHGAARRA